MKNVKKIISFVLVVTMLVSIGIVPVHATSISEKALLWENLSYLDVSLDFNNGSVIGEATKGSNEVAHMSGTLTLLKITDEGASVVGQWSGKTTGLTLTVSGSFTPESGAEYQATFKVTSYRESIADAETASTSVTETCP